MNDSSIHGTVRINHVICLAVCLAMALAAAPAAAELIEIEDFAATNGQLSVTSSTTMDWDFGEITVSSTAVALGLDVKTFEVDVTGFTANPGNVGVGDIVLSGFDDPNVTVTLHTGNETLETLGSFFGIGIGAITLDITSVSTSGGTPKKDGKELAFAVNKMVMTYQGPIVTAAQGGGSVVAGAVASASMTAVPEPSSMALVLLAGIALPVVWYRRRRR